MMCQSNWPWIMANPRKIPLTSGRRIDGLKTAAKSVGGEAFGDLVGKTIDVVKSFAAIKEAAAQAGEQTKISLSAIGEGATNLFGAFQKGNIGGAIKGITDFVSMVPGLSTFTPAIKAVGVAAEVAWPLVKEWYEVLSKSATAMDEAARSAKDYAKALREANVEIKASDELEKAKAADKAAAEAPARGAKDAARLSAICSRVGKRGRSAKSRRPSTTVGPKAREGGDKSHRGCV